MAKTLVYYKAIMAIMAMHNTTVANAWLCGCPSKQQRKQFARALHKRIWLARQACGLAHHTKAW